MLGRKHFREVLHDISFDVYRGEILGLVGESGTGKSTLAKTILGMIKPAAGEVVHYTKRPQMIFQDPYSSLNPAYPVEWLLEEPLRIYGKYDGPERKRRVREMLERVELPEEVLKAKPSELSGGQRQRVAFARALAPNPQVLLLDEPFAAIDAKVRTELRTWLKEMVTKLGITSIFVTHDQDEAVEVADEIIITNHGVVEQMGTPLEIYKSPDTPFVAQFIGRSSVVEDYDRLKGFERIPHADKAVIRPEFVKISKSGKLDQYISAAELGTVKEVIFKGNRMDVVVDINGIELTGERSLEKDLVSVGETVHVLIYRLYVFDEEKTYLLENKEMQEQDVFYI